MIITLNPGVTINIIFSTLLIGVNVYSFYKVKSTWRTMFLVNAGVAGVMLIELERLIYGSKVAASEQYILISLMLINLMVMTILLLMSMTGKLRV